jgi:hypothetical protein
LEFFLSEVEDDRLSARLKELREANRELVDAVKSRDEAAVEMALTAHEKALNRIMAYTMSPEDFTRSTPGPRFEERDDEIARLKDEVLPDGSTRSFGQVRQIVEEKWPIMQNGKPLTTPAVHGAYKRKKSKKRN